MTRRPGFLQSFQTTKVIDGKTCPRYELRKRVTKACHRRAFACFGIPYPKRLKTRPKALLSIDIIIALCIFLQRHNVETSYSRMSYSGSTISTPKITAHSFEFSKPGTIFFPLPKRVTTVWFAFTTFPHLFHLSAPAARNSRPPPF